MRDQRGEPEGGNPFSKRSSIASKVFEHKQYLTVTECSGDNPDEGAR